MKTSWASKKVTFFSVSTQHKIYSLPTKFWLRLAFNGKEKKYNLRLQLRCSIAPTTNLSHPIMYDTKVNSDLIIQMLSLAPIIVYGHKETGLTCTGSKDRRHRQKNKDKKQKSRHNSSDHVKHCTFCDQNIETSDAVTRPQQCGCFFHTRCWLEK